MAKQLNSHPCLQVAAKWRDLSRSRAAAGSLLRDTQAEIQQLESTGDPIFRQAANYSFPANAEDRRASQAQD